MRIVYTTTFQEAAESGAGRVAYEIANAAAKSGLDVAMLCPGNETKIYIKDRIKYCTVVSYHSIEASYPNLTLKNVRYIFKFLSDFKPDIVHSQHESFLGLVALIWALQNNVKFVLTCHILPTKVMNWLPASKDTQRLLKFLYTFRLSRTYFNDYFNNCDAIIALNYFAKLDLRKFGYKGDIWEIPNGVNLQKYIKTPISPLPQNNEKIKLIFIGHVNQRKNQYFLVKVMKYLPARFELKLVGVMGQDRADKDISEYISENNLHNVELTGPVDFREIPAVLANSHIFVSASKFEVQSLSVIEAMAAGKPVIGLRNETIDEFISETNGVILEKNTTPKAFASAILNLCNNPDQYLEKAKQAREKVKDMDWLSIIKRTEIKYKELINGVSVPKKPVALLKIIKYLPNKSIRKYLREKLHQRTLRRAIEKPEKKHVGLWTMVLGGAFFITSVIFYGFWKVRNKIFPEKTKKIEHKPLDKQKAPN